MVNYIVLNGISARGRQKQEIHQLKAVLSYREVKTAWATGELVSEENNDIKKKKDFISVEHCNFLFVWLWF